MASSGRGGGRGSGVPRPAAAPSAAVSVSVSNATAGGTTSQISASSSGGVTVAASVRDRLGHSVSEDDPRTLFELEERLGKGSFGSVYRGVHRRTGEWVAIKIISLAEEEAVDDVRREISILKECENSHIVKYYGSYFEQDNLWVWMHTPPLPLVSSFHHYAHSLFSTDCDGILWWRERG